MQITIEVQDEHEARAVQMLINERRRQDAKFGKQDHDPAWWMVIMGEEFGETCQAVCEYRWAEANRDVPDRMKRIDHAMEETSQVGAVAVAMIQAILRNEWRDEISTVLPSDKRQVAKALDWDDSVVRYDEPEDVEPTKGEFCYHCGLSIVKVNGHWFHSNPDKYEAWKAEQHDPERAKHDARYAPGCQDCGRDNVNHTHDALQSTGHLNHAFNPKG